MPAASADLTALAQDLAAAGDNIHTLAAGLIKDTATTVQQIATGMAPRDTGALANSIQITYSRGGLSAVIGPSVPYGVYQEFGTGSRGEFPGHPYEIRPKKAGGVLVFYVGGRKVVARKVIHPGVRAHPYMRPALLQALGPMAEQLADMGALSIIQGPGSTL